MPFACKTAAPWDSLLVIKRYQAALFSRGADHPVGEKGVSLRFRQRRDQIQPIRQRICLLRRKVSLDTPVVARRPASDRAAHRKAGKGTLREKQRRKQGSHRSRNRSSVPVLVLVLVRQPRLFEEGAEKREVVLGPGDLNAGQVIGTAIEAKRR